MSMCPSRSVSISASALSRRDGTNKYCKFLLPQLIRKLMTFWFLRRVRVSLLSSRDGASLLHAVVSREHGIVSARKLKQRGRCAKITLELPRQFQASRACPTRRRRSFEIPLARPASGTVGYASMSPRATTRFSRRARRIRARRRVASLASWGGGAPQAITQRIRTPGARVQKLETELFIGFLGGALAALALVGELLQALLQAALDGRFPFLDVDFPRAVLVEHL